MASHLKRSNTNIDCVKLGKQRPLQRLRSNSEPRLDILSSIIDELDSKGRTRLFYAARSGRNEIARALLEAGCNPDIQDADRNTALHEAVENSHSEMVRLLIRYGKYISKNI